MMTKTKQSTVTARFLLGFLLAGQLCFAALSPAQEQDDPVAEEPAREVAETKSLGDVYNQGGWIMHVLLVCSIGTIAIVVYCFVAITPKKMMPQSLVDGVNRTMQQRDVHGAYALCEEQPTAYGRVVSAALVKVNFERDLANKASMEQAAGETLDQEEIKQMLWVNYLNVFATLAPMIGLMGTVLGMIESFDQLARGASEPQDLAGGIGKAMSTTAGGLFVGIPAMFFYFFFRNRITAIVSLIQKNATFAIDVLSGEITLEATEEEGEEG
ncbi:MAG: MotA/TolQ/ExbB proton channel family protein [Verrucomicrobiales bacterium]